MSNYIEEGLSAIGGFLVFLVQLILVVFIAPAAPLCWCIGKYKRHKLYKDVPKETVDLVEKTIDLMYPSKKVDDSGFMVLGLTVWALILVSIVIWKISCT